jgi:hypothetical protein
MSLSKLKTPVDSKKISKSASKRGGDCPQVPAFSFGYLTTTKKYTLGYISDSNDRRTAIENVYNKLAEIGTENWLHWYENGKKHGLETLYAGDLSFSPSRKRLTPDEKVIVFRVKSYAGKEGRILGIREDGCPILHIIGYDFNYSAYNHG